MSERSFSERVRLAEIKKYALAEDEQERLAARADRDADRWDRCAEFFDDDDLHRIFSEQEPQENRY